MVFGYLRFCQGLGPGWPLLFAVVGGVGGVVRRKGLSLLGPSGPLVRVAFLFFPPPVGGGRPLLPPPRLRGMSALIQKVQSAKSGLAEAYASLLTGFEVCI